ncbi:hypothetical protein L873DRAFT_191697 [Choiromyces venosus 120613-1]|uniref:Uncharacterized protein n=1 Tax=Choiromyces venosus 120613-1 TaxID=1336337 RepID=A0A3N4J219_9PEZI|nr:hypothetical protein L873DRAFT_191697 [Choiromyces venosus 120613-1]
MGSARKIGANEKRNLQRENQFVTLFLMVEVIHVFTYSYSTPIPRNDRTHRKRMKYNVAKAFLVKMREWIELTNCTRSPDRNNTAFFENILILPWSPH